MRHLLRARLPPDSGVQLRATDLQLMEDGDLADVIPRLRARKKFWTTTEEDERLVVQVRDGLRRREEDEDEQFDLGSTTIFPVNQRKKYMGRVMMCLY